MQAVKVQATSQLFLDVNAHLPPSPAALEAFNQFNSGSAAHGHPASPNNAGRAASNLLEQARAKMAQLIGAKSSNQVFFTYSCSQACHWGLKIFAQKAKNISVSPFEHPAVSDVLEQLNIPAKKLPTDHNARLNSEGILDLICVYLQNEIGTIQPLKNLKTGWLFSDMSQALGKISVNVSELDVDIATFGAHKFGGFPGVGFMYLKNTADWIPFETGSRYCMDVTGSPNVAGIVASAAALESAISSIPARAKKTKQFQDILEQGAEELGLEVIAKGAHRSTNTSFLGGFKGRSLQILMDLGTRGIVCGLGSACGGISGNSRIVKTLGKEGSLHDFLRISNWDYGKEEAEYLVKVLKEIL